MSTWNYRVIEFIGDQDDEPHREIHEVHYDDAGNPIAYSESPATIYWFISEGESAPKLILQRMSEALDKPVLREADFSC